MNRSFIITIIAFVLCFTCCFSRAQVVYNNIGSYRVYYAAQGREGLLVIRAFSSNSKGYYLAINPKTLETRVVAQDTVKVSTLNWEEAQNLFKHSAYMHAIAGAKQAATNLQNAGIESGMPKQTGVSLTADLCPSHHALDRSLFTEMITAFQSVERPVPIALSVTGMWMRQHPADLEWLRQLQVQKQVTFTWINHSYNHRVSPTAPLRQNFLLEPGTDINYEVLETEKAMLKNGLLPSAFFRFPGLISDQHLVDRITAFGLIPVGSDAWLAKGQKTHAGSIVLIHANGNEPVGVRDFINLLHQQAGAIAKKEWLLYDLRESVSGEFEDKKN